MTGGGFSSIDDVYIDETVLVYDLGGGTFDTTVMTLHAEKKGEFTVLATDGDYQLGGKDWDERIVDFVYKEVERLHGYHPQYLNDPPLLQEIRLKAIEAKKALSERSSTKLNLFVKDKEYTIDLTREANSRS